jgi:hypothetical protein
MFFYLVKQNKIKISLKNKFLTKSNLFLGMTELNQTHFPYHIDVVVSNSQCLDFIRSLLENERSGRQKEFNLNLGFYKLEKKFKGEHTAPAEVLVFYKLSIDRDPEQVHLENNEMNSRQFSPVRMSMMTADYTDTHNGVVFIIPNDITDKTKKLRVFKGSRYGRMMGHGSVETWKKIDGKWRFVSTLGTWIT